MAKKNNAEINNNNSNLLFTPERKVIGAEEAKLLASRASDYNDSRSEARNWNRCEFSGIKFSGEDLSGIEAHYAKFVDCEFENCKLNRLEGHFSTWDNCIFKNCEISNANFSFSSISNLSFYDCNMNGTDFPFCQGNFGATQCMMKRVTANHSSLLLNLARVDAWGFEGNCSNLDLAISGSNFSRAEFCDSNLQGEFKNTNLTDAELNRSDLSQLHIASDCATHGMEKEDSTDDEIDSALDEALLELEEIVGEK